VNEQEANELFNMSASFEIDQENTIKLLKVTIQGLLESCDRLQKELRNCRNELCLKCGAFSKCHLGACDDCRYRHCGEWEADLHE